MKELMKVDIDVINRLKAQGRILEARELLKAYRDCCDRAWAIDELELAKKINKVREVQRLKGLPLTPLHHYMRKERMKLLKKE